MRNSYYLKNSFIKDTMASINYLVVVILSLFSFTGLSQAQLQLGFYAKSCPKAEKIVYDFVKKHIHNAPSLAASFIRMHFHDCFVRVSLVFYLLKLRIYCYLHFTFCCITLCLTGLWCFCASKLDIRQCWKGCDSKSNTHRLWLHWKCEEPTWRWMPWHSFLCRYSYISCKRLYCSHSRQCNKPT